MAACCYRGRSLLRNARARQALEALEQFADDAIARKQMEQTRGAWYGRFDYPFPIGGTWNSALAAATITHTKVWCDETADHAARAARNPDHERLVQARFSRDIFGNPFRPITFDSAWLTSTVTALAAGIYSEKAFDRMPVLAGALEETGCDNTDVLNHCRGPGPHVRGCWVVDAVLGKK